MLTQQETRERVARGAAHLDKLCPDWFNQIDVNDLDMADGCQCVLGQLHGDHYDDAVPIAFPPPRATGIRGVFGAKDKGRSFTQAEEYGFDVKDGLSRRADFRQLQDAWVKEIAARRLQPKLVETPQPETVTA